MSKETLTPVSECLAVHRDGEHQCVTHYEQVKEGEDLRSSVVFTRGGDGRFERLEGCGVPTHGPAQVATKKYRDSWERTFGAN